MPTIRFTRPKKKPVEDGEGANGGGNRLLSRVAWVLLSLAFLAAMLLDAFFSEKGMLRVRELEKEYDARLLEESGKREEIRELQEKIQALKDDPKAIEGVAREELGMVKPGEDVYLFAREPELILPPEPEEDKQTPEAAK